MPRTKDAITSVSSAWVRVTPVPNGREANFSVVPRSLGLALLSADGVRRCLILDGSADQERTGHMRHHQDRIVVYKRCGCVDATSGRQLG
ncbi:hypothetical protein ACIHFD_67425 [Nonomuraea sp. NPDC051941]|uniref:hypothetical protein n=1 Tax=Nonomuraea sp. NPDC051941 TaxID=3364373 RepID=UPI0037C86F9B